MPVWHQVFTILMIYALKTRKFVAALYAHFPQFFFDVKAESAKFFGIWGYSPLGHSTYVNSIPGKKLTFEAWQFCMGECQSKFWSLGFQTSCLFHSWHFSSLEVFFSVGGCHNCHIEGGSRNNWETFFSITPVGKKTGFPLFQKVSRFSANNATVTGCGEENCQEFHFSDAGKPKSCWCRLKPQNTQKPQSNQQK